MTKERHIFRSGRRRLRLLILPAVLLAAAGGGVWFWFEHSPARAVERMLLSIKGLEAEQVEEQSPDRILIRRISYRADDGVAAGCEGLEIGLDANGVPRSVSAAGVEIGRITQLLPLVAGRRAGERAASFRLPALSGGRPGKGILRLNSSGCAARTVISTSSFRCRTRGWPRAAATVRRQAPPN